MDLITCARPYAKAAFGYALDSSSQDKWQEMLDLGSVIVGFPQVADALSEPMLSKQQQADLFNKICKGSFTKEFNNFIKILSENRRILLLPEISLLYKKLRNEKEDCQSVRIVSAYPLKKKQLNLLAKKIETSLECSVDLATEVDPDILGGIVIKAGDLVMDYSLRARLVRLAEVMVS